MAKSTMSERDTRWRDVRGGMCPAEYSPEYPETANWIEIWFAVPYMGQYFTSRHQIHRDDIRDFSEAGIFPAVLLDQMVERTDEMIDQYIDRYVAGNNPYTLRTRGSHG